MDKDIIQLSGFIENTIYKNQLSGYTVFRLKSDEKTYVCAGIIQNLPYFTPVRLKGEFQENSEYPDTFHFTEYEEAVTSRDENIKYLIHGFGINNISIPDAEKMSEIMSDNIFKSVKAAESESSFLKMFPQKYKNKAKILYAKAYGILFDKKMFHLIASIGGTYSDVLKLEDKYAGKAEEMLYSQPYRIGYMLDWSFKICDKLAEQAKINPLDKKRAEGFLFYAMKMSASSGSTYTTFSELKKNIQYLFNNCYLGDISIEYILSFLVTNPNFVIEYTDSGAHIYFKKIRRFETNLVDNVSRLYESIHSLPFDAQLVDRIQREENVQLADDQKAAFNAFASEGVKIITGGPGRGKTTTINLLIKYAERMNLGSICLCAPTGCAAQRMSETTHHSACTIHYLIGARPFEEEMVPDYNASNRLPYKIYIIDEFSMADIELVSMLFEAIPNNAIVLIVGDSDQLESVGPGNVLNDFIESGVFEVYRLQTVFRQKNGSNIIGNADKIITGNSNLQTGSDFEIKSYEVESDALNACIGYLKTDKNEYQVLCPIKKHSVGTKNLNLILQEIKHKNQKNYKSYGDYMFYKNDKVITTKNNRKQGYFNGEPGIIVDIDDEGILIRFANDDEIYITNPYLNEVIPAHALTVHKSQGNEYPEVVLLLTETAKNMINTKILYTAITRAKNKVTIFCQNGIMSNIQPNRKRNTDLAAKLVHVF